MALSWRIGSFVNDKVEGQLETQLKLLKEKERGCFGRVDVFEHGP